MSKTMQLSPDEDRLINQLKKELRMPTKKSVVLTALQELWKQHQKKQKAHRLKQASLAVREESLQANQDYRVGSSASEFWDED